MTLQEVITKAIEGGYKGNKEFLLKLPEYAKSQIWLDTFFWQSLGKAMEWENNVYVEGKGIRDVKEWKQQWHRFIDALSEGKSAEDFFKEL